ncbi:MAG: methyltransferase domain-containing protein [Acidobacteriaceae bacterium]|nr:methyltransferase domain-containing protein [Acidobacteriaceae bacterium]
MPDPERHKLAFMLAQSVWLMAGLEPHRYTVLMTVSDATKRFSSRVNDYVRYRPGYPPEVISLLQTECGLKREHIVADIASGTGIFTRMLLENGNRVFAVEPNPEMRTAGEAFLAGLSKFTSVAGTAEATTLPPQSMDFVTAAQAAHWFDRRKARGEFVRILKPGGWTVLVWNERKTDGTPFLREYEQLLLTYGTDYREVRHERTTAEITEFFAPSTFKEQIFATSQELDHPSLKGRLVSSSYTPQAGHPNYAPMLAELLRMFEAHQANGRVSLVYDTRVFYGQLSW